MSIRWKVIFTLIVSSVVGTSLLWTFNVFYVHRDWRMVTAGLGLFVINVVTLVTLSAIFVFFFLSPVRKAQKAWQRGEEIGPALDRTLERRARALPTVFLTINAIGFFVGSLVQNVIRAIGDGMTPLNFTLLISIIYSTALGLYVAFIEIRMVDRYLIPLHARRNRTSVKVEKRHVWRGRQILLGFTLMYLVFGTMFSAGMSYLREEVLAPADVDAVASASQAKDRRSQLWAAALEGLDVHLSIVDPYVQKRLGEFTWKMLLLGGIIAGLALLAMIMESAPTEERLEQLNRSLRDLATGNADLDRTISITLDDEIGTAIHWINAFVARQRSLFSTIRTAGDRIENTSAELSGLSDNAEALGGEVLASVQDVQASVAQQSRALEQVETDLADMLENVATTNRQVQAQGAAVEESSSSIEEMTASIESVAKNAQEAYERTQGMIKRAGDGGREMAVLRDGIEAVVRSSEEVAENIGQIAKIAAQTNLLAMNAAIEAAHAGDAGRGFAVVASEVRKLATDASQVASAITGMVKAMNENSRAGMDQTRRAVDTFESISRDVEANGDIIATISQAMVEQNQGSREIRDAMQSLLEATHELTSLASTQSDESTNVRERMGELASAVELIQRSMESQNASMERIRTFTESLKEVIDRNTVIVAELGRAYGE